MQIDKNFEINPNITSVPEFIRKISSMDGWELSWRTICDARGNVLRYAVNSPVGNITYQITSMDDCLSMVMNNVKWLAECLDYGYVRKVENEA